MLLKPRMQKISISLLCIFFLSQLVMAENKKMTVVLQWVPQAQFSGYYMALEKGFYADHGLDMTIIPGGPNVSVIDNVNSGKADFGTFFLLNGIKLAAKDIPLVNIGQISRRSALMFIAKKSNGIHKPEDLNGKKIGIYKDAFSDVPLAFIKENNLDVNVIPIATGVNIFLQGGTDVTNVMWYNEYHTIMNCGYNPEELTTFHFADYGFDIPEDGIYCLESTFEQNPEFCEAFVEATMEGWRYAFDHPEETLDIIIREMTAAHIPANLAHQKWMLARMQDIFLPDEITDFNTELDEASYEKAGEILLNNGTINKLPDYQKFYKPVGKYVKK